MSTHNSNKAVLFALFGNLSIGIIKFIVSIITNSAGMLAEAIHSFVDTTNQILLLVGSKRCVKQADEQHAFGYGKEEYFWGFIVAVLLFFMGGAYSIYEGIHKMINHEPINNIVYIFSVLIVSILIEYKSFSIALKELKQTKDKSTSFIKHLKSSTDINVFVIIVEDFAALLGLLIVILTTILSVTISPIFDSIGSILIGILLIGSSYFMSNELRKLMIGENISREMRNKIKDIIKSFNDVKHVNNIRTMYIGNNDFVLLISIEVEDDIHVFQIEHMVSEMKNDINELYKNAKYIYIEI